MDLDERDRVAERFGVAPEQVERDHLISHLLGYLSEQFGDRVHFIGGTALARTYLPNGRLSEDIDLVAIGPRRAVAKDLDDGLPRSVARTHGRLTLEPLFDSATDTHPVIVRAAEGIAVKIQLLSSRDRVVWPAKRLPIEQRYSDAPVAELIVPTLAAFSASKTVTWADRRAPRDLWDLWALSEIGAIEEKALRLFQKFGPTNRPPGDYLFENPPSDAAWQTQLGGQTRLTITAAQALATVRDAWWRVVKNG